MLDTDITIFLLRGLKSRHRIARQKAEAIAARCRQSLDNGAKVGPSAITVSELENGAQKSGDYEAEIAAMRKILLPFTHFNYDCTACSVQYGVVRHDLTKRGVPIGPLDTMIAAHALAVDATLVTNNLAHFGRVSGLKLENWIR